jgi:uncharacterized integral membrane protein (TIGR00698 family)
VGWAGKFVEHFIARYGKAHHLTLPNIEYVLWAILIGIVISNTVGVSAAFRPGLATYEFWLKAGIVLLGSRFSLGDVVKLRGVSLILVAIEITVSLLFMTALGKAFKLSPKLTDLLAIGSSICGVSAVIAAQGAIDADEEDSSYAIAAVLALGAVALFTFPLIGHALGMSDTSYGIWAGLGWTTLRRLPPPVRCSPTLRAKSPCWPRPRATPRSASWCWATPFTGRASSTPPGLATRRCSCGRSFPSLCSAFC